MPAQRKARSGRVRVGDVSLFRHRISWWIYYRENGRPVRRRVGRSFDDAKAVAAEVNAQLAAAKPTAFSFEPVSVANLAERWLDFHERIARSSLNTVRRYRAAANHLTEFVAANPSIKWAHHVEPEHFVGHLRGIRIAPNGHPNATRRPLRDKGVVFILSCCRSMYRYAERHRLLPPYFDNPFTSFGVEKLRIQDAKPIHIFNDDEAARFLSECDPWQFPPFFILAQTGMRPGELVHLLVRDIDPEAGEIQVRDKPELGWQVKTRRARTIPVFDETVDVLRWLIGSRSAGVLLMRRRFTSGERPQLADRDARQLQVDLDLRCSAREHEEGRELSREERHHVAYSVWRDAGRVRCSRLRVEFMRVTKRIGAEHITSVKTWRHSFATLMQDANVDPLIRQQVLGHAAASGGRDTGLGATALYTHTRPETYREQIRTTLDLQPRVRAVARAWIEDHSSEHKLEREEEVQ